MKSKSDFRSSKSEAENRLTGVAKTFDAVEAFTDFSVCLKCGHQQKLRRGEAGQLYLPFKCPNCEIVYSQKFQYCVPDLILTSKDRQSRFGIVFVNEGKAHGKNSVVERDKTQINLLWAQSYEVFVITDTEIYSMTDSSLRLWLLGAARALESLNLPQAIYNGEKEYRCLNY